jgi:hypothetical protein
MVRAGDFVFFVLPKRGQLPQMLFGYLKVKETITHTQAHNRVDLVSKRMGNKNPNGNIIVDGNGAYNRFDAGVHRGHFDEIKQFYVVGDRNESRLLKPAEIRRKAPSFMTALSNVFHQAASTPYGIISRKGRRMTGHQVNTLLRWVNE